MKKTQIGYEYRGQRIYSCERVHGTHTGRWIVQSYHATGLPLADELCGHYHTLAEAKAAISEQVAYTLAN